MMKSIPLAIGMFALLPHSAMSGRVEVPGAPNGPQTVEARLAVTPYETGIVYAPGAETSQTGPAIHATTGNRVVLHCDQSNQNLVRVEVVGSAFAANLAEKVFEIAPNGPSAEFPMSAFPQVVAPDQSLERLCLQRGVSLNRDGTSLREWATTEFLLTCRQGMNGPEHTEFVTWQSQLHLSCNMPFTKAEPLHQVVDCSPFSSYPDRQEPIRRINHAQLPDVVCYGEVGLGQANGRRLDGFEPGVVTETYRHVCPGNSESNTASTVRSGDIRADASNPDRRLGRFVIRAGEAFNTDYAIARNRPDQPVMCSFHSAP